MTDSNPNPPSSVGPMNSITNQTLETLLVGGGAAGTMTSVGMYTFEDLVFEKYYNAEYKASELNIDFTDYANFVFYGTAEGRLRSFRNKILKIEALQRELEPIFPSASVSPGSFTTSSIKYGPVASINDNIYVISPTAYQYTGSADTPYYVQEKTKEISLAIEGIIRGFDPYEQFLFFDTTNAPYSASYAYAPGGTEYHVPASWPKNSIDQVYSPLISSGSDWYDEQLVIAQRYDQFNPNNLIFTVPMHILEDDNSVDFITFVSMIGHFFDTIKPYIDQYTNVFDRNPNPNEGLSKELISEVAESFGIKLPNIMSVRNIQEYVLGSTDAETVRDATAETWKRLLHNLTYIQKTKGTRASIDALFRSLGFHPAVISVKETGLIDTTSYQVVDEFTNALRFYPISQSNIRIPQALDPQALQFRFSTEMSFATFSTSSLFTADSLWKAELVAHPTYSSQQRIEVKSSNLIPRITSSYYTFNDGDFYDVMLRKLPSGVDLTVIKNDGGEIIYSSSNIEASSVILPLWDSTTNINLGGAGPLVFRNFDGLMDEVRLWGEVIGDTEFIAQTNDPGSFVGNSYSSSIENLYFQLSFLNEENLSLGYITNESPYEFKSTLFPTASLTGFVSNSQYDRIERLVRYNIPTLGASSYVTTQIKVPDFSVTESIAADGVPTLYPNRSHTLYSVGTGSPLRQITIAISPTDFINQRISRVFGALNLTDAIGDPSGLLGEDYPKLRELQNYYSENFVANVDPNKLITIFETLIANMRDYILQLIPAHSNLIFGILIEQNMLERRKLNPYRTFKVDGSNTRRTLKAMVSESYAQQDDVIYVLEDTIDYNAIMDYTGAFITYDAVMDAAVTEIIDETSISAPFYDVDVMSPSDIVPVAEYSTYETFLSQSSTTVHGDYFTYDTVLSGSHLVGIPVYGDQAYPDDAVDFRTYPTLDIDLDLQLDSHTVQTGLIFNLPPDLTTQDDTYYRAISPLTNFNDIGVTTYFNNPDGIYLLPVVVKTAIPTGILNFSTQSWAQGNLYSRNDVVVQRMMSGDAEVGNERYYRFIANTSDPVASFVAPYLDGTMWEPVRFTGITTTKPKRIVFDQQGQSRLDVIYSKLNIIDPTKILATNNRAYATFTGISLTSGSTATGVFNIQNIFALLGYQATVSNIRMRLFRTAIDRDSVSNSLLDLTIGTISLVALAEVLVLYNNNNPVTSTVYYRFDNLDSLVKNFDITFYYFGIDAKPLVPLGYLPRHYKFYRDNRTATKRHSWLGCLQTQDTTLDGESPIQIIVSPSSDLIVAPGSSQTDLTIGSGGTLNVT